MLSTNIHYSIIYSKRKTMSICIDQDGSVIIRAPQFISMKEIERIVNEKRDWIEKKQKQMIERSCMGDNNVRTYKPISTMPFLGREYPLRFIQQIGLSKPYVCFENDEFLIRYNIMNKEEIQTAFQTWYYDKAKEIFKERISFYYSLIKEPFGQVRIKEQKSCYGSCSSKRNLNFNWKCILAPIEILDYVVVHEMCHLKQLNHSKMFWTEVENILPDYKVRKQWLKSHKLDI